MAQTLVREKQRVRKEISEFSALEKFIDQKRYKPPHIREFREFITFCKNTLEKDFPDAVLRITKGYPPTEQSSRLAELRFMIKHLRELIFNFLLSSFEIPRELYFLSDLFLKYHECKAKYLICVSEEIATLPLTYILRQLGFEEICPSFWKSIKNQEFYFVQATSGLKNTKSSEDWPILLHELAHIICHEQRIEDEYYPAVSVYLALRVMELLYKKQLSPEAPLVGISTKKLYATEYLADLLVTRCFGATFGWRFVEGYVDLIDIFEPDRYHPPPDRRLERIAAEVGPELNLLHFSELLQKKKQVLVGELEHTMRERIDYLDVDVLLKDVNSVLDKLLKEIRKRYTYSLTTGKIRENIQESPWFRLLSRVRRRRKIESKISENNFLEFLEELKRDFSEGTPIIVDPPTLYLIYMLESTAPSDSKHKIEDKELLNELIADSIRLYAVQHLFSG